jgi:tRNA(Ile)-lysidine synthase
MNERGLNWRTDATNFDCRFKRNFIRHRLLPELAGQSSKPVAEYISRLSEAARKFQDFVDDAASTADVFPQIASHCETCVMLDIDKFARLHPAIKMELIYKSLMILGCPERNLTQGHYERILRLSQSEAGNKKIDLPGFFTVRREYANLIFERPLPPQPKTDESFENIEIAIPSKIQKGGFVIETQLLDSYSLHKENFRKDKSPYIEWFDFDKIIQPVIIRTRKTGDRFHPLGLPAEKRIGKFLTDQKIPDNLRRKILIVSDREKILWVWPIRISEPAKVTGQTKKILQLRITGDQTGAATEE